MLVYEEIYNYLLTKSNNTVFNFIDEYNGGEAIIYKINIDNSNDNLYSKNNYFNRSLQINILNTDTINLINLKDTIIQDIVIHSFTNLKHLYFESESEIFWNPELKTNEVSLTFSFI